LPLSLILACVWFVLANVLALLPSRDNHWMRAYILIAVGIPILGFVTLQLGPWIGLLILLAGASILRWPLIYVGRWLRRQIGQSS
jgi:hypothetical protein